MSIIKILILSIIQGAAELLPVSSSAHVIVAEKLMGLDPTSPEMTLLLVMLHTGTMFAVIFYFWSSWRDNYFSSRDKLFNIIQLVTVGTVCTGIIGIILKIFIERVVLRSTPHAEIELLFGNLTLIAISLAAVGIVIIYAGTREESPERKRVLGLQESLMIGLGQGLCLPFRGFSRSGATISIGLVLGIAKTTVEEFSFALAVVLTPPVIIREVLRLLKAHVVSSSPTASAAGLFYPSIMGMVLSFISGLVALKWLSSWFEHGRWKIFGYYCLCAAIIILSFSKTGFLK